jgi:dihydrofolate reductase
MRKVTIGCANSLDNFIAREDGAVDWLLWSDEAGEIMKEYWSRIDTMVMGRKTGEIVLKELSKHKGKKGKSPYGEIKTYIFSHTVPPMETDDVTVLKDDPAKFVRSLKKKKGKEICVMGGGEFAKLLFEAGVIDEIGFNIHPVLLGAGIPLFHEMSRQIDLELIESRALKNGCVYVLYRVNN